MSFLDGKTLGPLIDIFADIAFLVFDVGTIIYDALQGDWEAVAIDVAALGADAVAAGIPGVTGAGILVRTGDKVNDVARSTDNIVVAVPDNSLGDAVDFATSQQGCGAFPEVDDYTGVVLQPGDRVHRLEPAGDRPFFFTDDTLRLSGGSAGEMTEALQIPHNELYRPTIRQEYRTFEVNTPTNAARGEFRANPQHGTGGGEQIVIPTGARELRDVGGGSFSN